MEEKKRAVVLNPQRHGLAEHKRQDWVVDAEEGTLIQDVQDPQYWAHVAPLMKVYDHIEVRLETGEWLAEFVVLNCERSWAKVHMTAYHELAPVDKAPVPSKFQVKWKGPHIKFAVIRESDGEKISEGHSDQAAARLWLEQYERQTA